MSTEIKDTVTGWGPHRLYVEDGIVVFHAIFGTKGLPATMARADFLTAVAAECGVIVIERAELPEVSLTSNGEAWSRGRRGHTAKGSRADALAYLALAEYLDAHPPIDEALVDDLATAAYRHLSAPVNFDRSDAARYIRALIKSGRIEVKP